MHGMLRPQLRLHRTYKLDRCYSDNAYKHVSDSKKEQNSRLKEFFDCCPHNPQKAFEIIDSIKDLDAITEFQEKLRALPESYEKIARIRLRMTEIADQVDALNEEFYNLKREQNIVSRVETIRASALLILEEKQQSLVDRARATAIGEITGLDQR